MSFNTDDDSTLSDINVTPFVDVLLVLLIIFMVTAPIVNKVVQVELPKDAYAKEGDSANKTMRITIDFDGLIYVNDTKIGVGLDKKNKTVFLNTLTTWVGDNPANKFVDLEADENVQYKHIVPVIARLKELGVGMNLVIQEPSN